MSNRARDWQEGIYTVRVTGNLVKASKAYKDKVDGHICYKKSSACAKCDPEDEFSLSMGVALAMDRLNKELSKNKIEVGDKVRIKLHDRAFTTYSYWIKKNINDVELAAYFAYGQTPDADDAIYVVKAVAPWNPAYDANKMLAYVQKCFVCSNGDVSNDVCYLIGVEGLEKV